MSPNALSERPPVSQDVRRNRRVAIICAATFFGMIGMAYASVPLYRAFCQITGFDGAVRRAQAAPGQALDRMLTVRFDANVRGLPWSFTPKQTSQTLRIGDTGIAFYQVTNNGRTAMTGRAVYNVVPEAAGAYFQKLQCFCFSDQTVQAGQTVEFPVLYFIDPAYADDFETKGKGQVTLSYTFYPAVDGQKQAAASPAKAVSALGGTPRTGL